MTRKNFLQTVAGAAAGAALSGPRQAAAAARRPRRGVSLYCYTDNFGIDTSLEDCFAEIDDLATEGQEMGLEILANGHIEGYPNPSDAWLKQWFDLLKKYRIRPVEYGHWVDSRLYKGSELDTRQSYNMLVRDIRLANRLGFTVGRTKLGVIDRPGTPTYDTLTPVTNWREFIKMALPVAEKHNFRMCPEIHAPTLLKSKMIDDYVTFIEKEKTTPWFGLNIDFGVFQNRPRAQRAGGRGGAQRPLQFSPVSDMVPLLPYVHACHAKFFEMTDDCEDPLIPYKEIVDTLIKHNWDGYLLSEYEGTDRGVGSGSFDAVRKQHVMLKRLLGEA